MWVLKSYQQPIPGNYFYVQSTGIEHKFKANPIVEEVAKAVSALRIANQLPRASLAESLEDVDTFNCAVRKNDERWCRWCEGSFESAHANHRFINRNCAGCGLVVTQD